MIIRKIRLKNIKSYGAGPEENGITIEFDRGLNRIGGRNGAGKSSIIEAIGYALFDAEPIRGDNRIKVETYLVRNGSKNGEIDAWVETSDCLYRIERDAGQVIRRWKVIREDDGFLEAEGDQEVRVFLARLWGLSGPERLSEVFHGLIGVKQGRFTLPFDCSPSIARGHFDPLLDVDIFRQCFDYLLEPLRMLNEAKNQTEKEVSGFTGQITQLQDAPEKVAMAEKNLAEAGQELEQSSSKIGQIRVLVQGHESAYQVKLTAEKALAEVKSLLQDTRTRMENAQKEVAESEAAREILKNSAKDYQAYRVNEAGFQESETRRKNRDLLIKEEHQFRVDEGRLAEEKRSLESSLKSYQDFAQKKMEEAKNRHGQLQNRETAFTGLKSRAAEQTGKFQNYTLWLERVKGWAGTLQSLSRQFNRELPPAIKLAEELTIYPQAELAEANGFLEEANRKETEARIALGKAEQQKTSLAKQLESISGGVCPFLGEPCRQFNPGLVHHQLEALETEIEGMKADLTHTCETVAAAKIRLTVAQQAEKEFLEKRQSLKNSQTHLHHWWLQVDNLEARQAADELDQLWPGQALPALAPVPEAGNAFSMTGWESARNQLQELTTLVQAGLTLWQDQVARFGKENQLLLGELEKEKGLLEQERKQIGRLCAEAKEFEQKVEQDGKRIADIDGALAGITEKLAATGASLREYTGLDEKMADLRRQLEEQKPGYTLYLQHEPVAGKLAARTDTLKEALIKLEQNQEAAREAEQICLQSTGAYDQTAHQHDQAELQQALQAQGEIQSRFKQAQAELAQETVRLEKLTGLLAKRKESYDELDHLLSQTAVLEKARTVLKNSQTLVAQGLTRRIQNRAQGIYHSMSPEPAEFEWEAGDYRLTLNTLSGARRFTQLSGGQQMKVALAMQLALVKEFSTAGICAFDEPTYGLDSESRMLLADAIARVQRESGFEQLLVVSHDEAFNDKVEHEVDLEYSGVGGTRVG
jgi:DNA repair protein SbcC/Rad50